MEAINLGLWVVNLVTVTMLVTITKYVLSHRTDSDKGFIMNILGPSLALGILIASLTIFVVYVFN